MAAEVHSDLSLIQDEDVLRRMWADTEDFGRKKEIRARMYKLREQRLKDFYTAGDVSQMTRKHATIRHTESIGDQGFLSMKSKEIRDSESPTRDFSRALITTTNDDSGYWNARQESGNVTKSLDDGGIVKETFESTEGKGVIRGANCETELSVGSENKLTKVSKSDDNSVYEAENLNQSSKMASVTKTDNGEISQAQSESYNVSKSHEESKSSDQQTSSKSWSSSSRSVKSSSKMIVSSSSYVTTSDAEDLKAITSGDISSSKVDDLRNTGDRHVTSDAILTSKDATNENDLLDVSDHRESLVKSTVNRSEKSSSSSAIQQSSSTTSRKILSQTTESTSQKLSESDIKDSTLSAITKVTSTSGNERLPQNVPAQEVTQVRDTDASQVKEIVNLSQTTGKTNEINKRISRAESVKSETESLTNQKILTEIHKLDTYLSTHTPAASTPVSPLSTTADVANWTIVSKDNRDNEFTYESRRDSPASETPKEKPLTPMAPRSQEKHDKNSSNIDLPKEATEGQYVTTYQSHYQRPNRISVENTPSHDYFASTLRASPDRQTPSPTKSKGSRNSLDRSSPERKWRHSPRNTTSPSTERGTPDSRPPSRPSDRKTPERKQRTPTAKTPDREKARKSPVKSPERDRRPSTGSYTIERPRSETRRKSDVRIETKTRRKFSSTQQKQETKARASTPGTSPTLSPTRKPKEKDSTDSDSDNSQATFKKSKSDLPQSTEERRTAALNRQKDLQKEETSEYFSEGSITNELAKKSHEPSPERSAFTPIKNFRTNPESGTFIKGERMQVTQEIEISQQDGKQSTEELKDLMVTTTGNTASESEAGIKGFSKLKSRSPSSSPERSQPTKDGKQLKKPSAAVPSKPKATDKPDRSSVTASNVENRKHSSTNLVSAVTVSTEDRRQKQTTTTVDETRKADNREKYSTDSSRSASVSPERKASVKRTPERKILKGPVDSPDHKPGQRINEKSPSVSPTRSPQRNIAPTAKGKSPSPERKALREKKVNNTSPERPSNSPSSSPEYTPIKRRSPERKPTSAPLSSRTEKSTNKSVEQRTKTAAKQTTTSTTHTQDTSTIRRSSIPKVDKKLTPKNSRDDVLKRPQDRPSPQRQPQSTNKPTTTVSQRQPTRSPQKVSPSTTVKTTEVIQRRTTRPSPTTTVTSRTTTKTTTVQVSKTPERPKPSTSQIVSKPSSYGTPRKSPQVINKKPASPATTPKGKLTTSNQTVSSKVSTVRSAPVPSRTQPLKPKEPVRKTTPSITRNSTQSRTTIKTQNQLKSRQLIEAEFECASDLEDVTPPEHFDVDIDDEEEPKEQFEEIDTKAIINNYRQQKITQEKVKTDNRKIKKRDTKIGNEQHSSSSEDETDGPNETIHLPNSEPTPGYLNVVVQHPKSSRESSPGYTSERVPLSTTSDDVESNPRYADFVSEPEDVEIFDTLRGGRGPIPLKEDMQTTDLDETDISRTSVADKVNVFLEAAKNSLEVQDHHQPVEIDGKHSVRSAKTLFESISKAQATTVQTSKKVDIHDNEEETLKLTQKPESIEPAPGFSKPTEIMGEATEAPFSPTKIKDSTTYHKPQVSDSPNKPTGSILARNKPAELQSTRVEKDSTEPLNNPKEPLAPTEKTIRTPSNADEPDEGVLKKTRAYQERTPANEPQFIRKAAYLTCEREEIQDTTNFKEREIEETQKTTVRKDTPVPEPIETLMAKKPKKPFERNISASADVNSKRNFFERKVQEQGKKEPEEDVRPLRNGVSGRKRSTETTESSFMKSTVASTVRAQSPDKVHKPVERNLTSEDLKDKTPEGKRKESLTHSAPGNEKSTSPKKEVSERKSSTEMSSIRTVRKQSPVKEMSAQSTNGKETSPTQKKEVVERKSSTEISSVRTLHKYSSAKEPQTGSPKERDFNPTKSFDQDDLRSPLKVRDSNTILRSTETEEVNNRSTGKFGVTLRKTLSNTKMMPTETSQPSKPALSMGEAFVIEEIFDLEILEKMLVKAVAYEERRRIRAQIRLVKKQLEEEHNRSGNRPSATTSSKPWASKEKSPERNSSTSRRIDESNKFKNEERWSSSRRSPDRKPSSEFKQTTYREVITTSSQTKTRESPERRLSSQKSRDSPERRISKPRTRDSPEKIVRKPARSSPETIVKQPSRSSPERRVSQTDSRSQVKSESKESTHVTTYQATVKTQSSRNITTEVKGSATDSITSSYGVGPTDDDGKPLFGLRALRRTNTNKALGESDEQEEVVIQRETRRESASEDILDSSGRPLFGGLKALQSESMPAQTSQLKELVERNQLLVQGGSMLESTKTVVTSHSSVSSDGKVSHRRDVVRGELMAKNGEQPVGKITQSTYSYQKDNEKGSTPQITSKTVTSVIGGRRDSGPRIEEITDGSQSTTSRRYSKEYTVEEDSSVTTDRRRSSTGLNEDNVRAFTSILKNKEAGIRKSSLETSETETRTSKFSTDETSKKTLTRGDSIKALQHKFQQATEAANQPSSRSYPKAGLILRSNSLHSADDQPQLSSSMKHASTTQSSRTADVDGVVVTTTQTRTSEDSKTVKTASTGSPTVSQTATRTEVRTGGTSFLDNSSKVTGVQDILQRMRNADLVSETGDTTEDAEARALLNKFLGASVILQGMEQGMKAAATQSSTTLVNQADKQWVKATSQRTQDDLADIYDEKQLQLLLDSCTGYEERRKIRAKLRDVMAEKKGGSSVVAGEGGSGLSVEDNVETTGAVTKSGQSFSKTEVQTRVVSSPAKLTKANSIQSPFAKFKQLERQNSAPSVSRSGSFTITSSASSIKERLLEWVQAQTRDYKNVQIENFSTSWSNGLAFCALIHHFCPDAFDYSALTPQDQRHNFQLAFTVAEEKADIYPLLDVEDMVMMARPDWKCVFTYVQSIYRRFHDSPLSNPTNPYL